MDKSGYLKMVLLIYNIIIFDKIPCSPVDGEGEVADADGDPVPGGGGVTVTGRLCIKILMVRKHTFLV